MISLKFQSLIYFISIQDRFMIITCENYIYLFHFWYFISTGFIDPKKYHVFFRKKIIIWDLRSLLIFILVIDTNRLYHIGGRHKWLNFDGSPVPMGSIRKGAAKLAMNVMSAIVGRSANWMICKLSEFDNLFSCVNSMLMISSSTNCFSTLFASLSTMMILAASGSLQKCHSMSCSSRMLVYLPFK